MAVSQNEPETHARNGKHHDSSHEKTMHDAAQNWFDFYQKMTEESMSAFQRGMEMSQKAAGFTAPFGPGQEMFRMWSESMQDFTRRMGGEPFWGDPASFRRAYDAWLESWAVQMETYMRTPEFAAKSGQDLEAMSDMKKRMGKMLEAYWDSIHLPSAADMREVYHKLYLMERKMDDMDRHLRDIKKMLEAQAGGKGGASTRSK